MGEQSYFAPWLLIVICIKSGAIVILLLNFFLFLIVLFLYFSSVQFNTVHFLLLLLLYYCFALLFFLPFLACNRKYMHDIYYAFEFESNDKNTYNKEYSSRYIMYACASMNSNSVYNMLLEKCDNKSRTCLPWLEDVRCNDDSATLNKITFHILDNLRIVKFPTVCLLFCTLFSF